MTFPRHSRRRQFSLALLVLTTALTLSACGGGETGDNASPATTLSGQTITDKALLYGDRKESFSTVQRLYEANPGDSLLAARYAKVLRESGDIKKAKAVLDKVSRDKSAPTLAYTELAALNLETGNFTGAETASRRAIKADNDNYRAWHILGISLDAQQKHPQAQTAFEKALSMWKGDPVPVMNNLALNLAAQGETDKALEMLYEAKKKDPGRIEIERNIRIIRTLNEPATYDRPKPKT